MQENLQKPEGAASGQAGHPQADEQSGPQARVPHIVLNEPESVESYNKFNNLKDGATEAL